jgi:hypothetical protein
MFWVDVSTLFFSLFGPMEFLLPQWCVVIYLLSSVSQVAPVLFTTTHTPSMERFDSFDVSQFQTRDDYMSHMAPDCFADLDMVEQQGMVAAERWKIHQEWCEREADKGRYQSLQHRTVSLRLLVDEACRLEQGQVAARLALPEDRKRGIEAVKRQWAKVGNLVLRDMEYVDNSGLVLKNLSCMCAFVAGKQCHEYGDNASDRMERILRQSALLQDLRDRGGLFVHPPEDDEELRHRENTEHGLTPEEGSYTDLQEL